MPIHTDALGLNECFTHHLIAARGTVHHITEHWIPISSLVGIIFSVSLESPHCVVWLGASQRVSNGCFLADEDATLVLNTALAGESSRVARTKQWIEVVGLCLPLTSLRGSQRSNPFPPFTVATSSRGHEPFRVAADPSASIPSAWPVRPVPRAEPRWRHALWH